MLPPLSNARTPSILPEATGYANGSWPAPAYRSASWRESICVLLFAAAALCCFVALIQLAQLLVWPASRDPDEVASLNDNLGWAYFYLVCVAVGLAIAVPAWLSRVVANLPALGGGTPSGSPAQTIVWWFVPFANLIGPFRTIRETWHRYAIGLNRGHDKVLPVWWTSFLGGTTLTAAAVNAMMNMSYNGNIYADNIDEMTPAILMFFGGLLLLELSAILGILIVAEIHRRAEVRVRSYAPTPAPVFVPPYAATRLPPGALLGRVEPPPGSYVPPYATPPVLSRTRPPAVRQPTAQLRVDPSSAPPSAVPSAVPSAGQSAYRYPSAVPPGSPHFTVSSSTPLLRVCSSCSATRVPGRTECPACGGKYD